MKSVFCVFISIAFLTVLTDFNELLKMPKLVHHFHEHSSSHHDLSFSEFLYFHYSDHHEHEDKHDESSLPYKSSNTNFFSALILPSVKQKIESITFEAKFYSKRIIKNDFIQSDYFGKIWQPPKSA